MTADFEAVGAPAANPWFSRALVIFPVGLVVFSIIALGMYLNHQAQVRTRTIRYAAGLRQPLTAERLARHEQILRDAATQPAGAVVASSYVASTLGPENMGYDVRALRPEGQDSPETPTSAFEAELTGETKPRDVVLWMTDYPTSLPTAAVLSIAHDLSGKATTRTLRFCLLRDATALELYYERCVHVSDRISHIVLTGALAGQTDAEVLKLFHLDARSTEILRPELSASYQTPLQGVTALRDKLVELADRF
jgi:hypothetical protein